MPKNLRQKSLYAFLGAMLPLSQAYGGVFTYEIRSFDSDRGIDYCNQVVVQAAAKFASSSEANVISSGCDVESSLGRIRGKVVYSAKERVNPWSTTSTTYGEEREFYNSLAQCEERLEHELRVFQDLTQLTPFLSLCHKTSEIGPPRYRTRIDAIGRSDYRRFESTATIRYTLTDANSVVSKLQEQAVAMGLVPVAWYAGGRYSFEGLSVAYYAVSPDLNPSRLLGKGSLYFSSLQECQAAQTAFQQNSGSTWNGVTACSAAHPTVGYQFNLIWWDKGIGADLILKSTTIPGNHGSLSACREAAAELSKQLISNGEQVVGIVCGRDSSASSPLQMELISYNP